MKKKFIGAVLAAVTAGMFLSACSLFRDTADSVFDDCEDAIASDRTAASISSADFMYEFDEGRGSALVRYKDPAKVRIDVLDGDRTMVFCLNKESGWMYLRGEIINMTAEDIAQMHGALLQTIPFDVNFQDIFGNAELLTESEFACGEECDVICANFRRYPDVKVKFWFGQDSDLLRQFEVDRDDGVHTVQYFSYRTFDDVTLPTHMYKFSPEGSSKLTLISFEANPEISDSVFRKPGKLSALKGEEK